MRQFLASTNGGGGTIRLREGNYLSPPIVLGAQPQTVTFPVARPQTVAAPPEVITIEGNATGVVLTSPVTSWRHVFDSVNGVLAFEIAMDARSRAAKPPDRISSREIHLAAPRADSTPAFCRCSLPVNRLPTMRTAVPSLANS